MKRSRELLIKKIWVLLIIAFMMMTSFLSTNTISADDPGIKTSDELQAAINAAADGATIVIENDIAMKGKVTINKKITIKGKEGTDTYTLFQKQRDTYDTMFVVEEGGDLTLGKNLVLTGKNGKCQSAKVTPYVDEENIIHPAQHKLGEFEQPIEPSEEDADGWLGFKRNQAGTGYLDNVAIVNSKETASTDEYGGSYIWIENGYIYCKKPNDEKQKQLGANSSQVQFSNEPSVPIKVGENGELTAAFSSSITWYVHSNGDTLYANSTSPGIYAFGSKPVAFANSAPASGTQWVIGEQTFKKPDQQKEADAALAEYNNARYTYNGEDYTSEDDARTAATLYWQVEGDSTQYPDEKSARAAAEDAGPCSVGTCTTYSTDNFEGGSIESPKGFFIQIDGGKATLDGATLEHFYTSTSKEDTVKHAAPVVANGEGSVFDIKSGYISNNVVGYIVKDADSNQDANAIKKYIKGVAPNAHRAPDSEKRRNAKGVAGIDGEEAGSGITGTAGAVIYIGGAKGNISGGNISYNRGDTGGIMVSGDADVTMVGGEIDHNVGVQFGGGSFVEDGGSLTMENGRMFENVAWFGGGAVFATENGIAWLLGTGNKPEDYISRKDGKFTLKGGTLEGNTAFTRGGAILADSDGVILINGKIINNKARMLGGAIYVMGDDENYTYTVYIRNGYVHDNKAVASGDDENVPATRYPKNQTENIALSQILKSVDPCENATELWAGDMTVNSDDMVDVVDGGGVRTAGTGGGIWLCAYGTSNINLDYDVFIVNNNYASGTVQNGFNGQPTQKQDSGGSGITGGNDLHKDPYADGSVFFSGITDQSKWYNENTGELFTKYDPNDDHTHRDNHRLNLVNTSTKVPDGYQDGTWVGVDFSGNISRRGGALAADGTYIFGEPEDIADIYAEMEINKIWGHNITPKDIVIRVSVEKKGKKYFVEDVPLSKTAKETSEMDTVFTDNEYKGRFAVPIFVPVEDAGEKIQTFNVKVGNKKYDNLNNLDQLKDLASQIKAGGKVTLDTSDVKFVFEEGTYNDDGKFIPNKENFAIYEDVKVATTTNAKVDTMTQEPNASFTFYKSNIHLTNKVINDKGPEIEKYVNEAVHKDINLDEIFTYDILAYITMDADKFSITDTLVDDLEFVGNAKVYDLGKDNNHKVTNNIAGEHINDDATVADTTTEITTASIKTEGNTLTVTMDDNVKIDKDTGDITRKEDVLKLRGHWVKVTFQAQIKKELQDRIRAGEPINKVLSFESINADKKYKDPNSIYKGEDEYRPEPNVGNKPVESEEDHQGVINTASYVIEVFNGPEYKDESNTVTVKPDIPEVEKYVNQAVHKDIELDEVFTYDIIGLISNNADKVTFKDKLVDDLEIVDEDDIEIVYLDENNHKPYNDISGNVVNPDASVAQKGTSIKDEEGVTVEVKDNCLIVTLDDGVDGRERELVKDLRGKYVKVTFKAQIKKELQNKIKAGEMKITDLKNVTVNENGLVLSDEKHNGIDNRAIMFTLGNNSEIRQETNVVTVGPEVVTVVVKKIWDDGNNADKIRPDTVTIILLADGKEVERVKIAYKDNWSYTFANLAKTKDGKKIVYTVDEVSVKGYKKTINGYEITNTHIPDKPKRDYEVPKTGVK